MGTTFVPLAASLIDEGEFIADIDAELAEVQKRLIEYVGTFGDKAAKAAAKLQIEITIVCANPDKRNQAYAIKTQIKTTFPKRPASVSLAMAGESQDETPCLFVRKSGSDNTPPAQGKLSTRDGRTIGADGEPDDAEFEGE